MKNRFLFFAENILRFIEADYNELITVCSCYRDDKTPHYQCQYSIRPFVHIYLINNGRELGKFNNYNRFKKKHTSLREELGVDSLKVLLVHHSARTLLKQKQRVEKPA